MTKSVAAVQPKKKQSAEKHRTAIEQTNSPT